MTEPNAQTKIIERDIARLADDHQKLNERFDRHLEIYAQNGKELSALKVEVGQLVNVIKNMEYSHGKNNDNQWVEIKQNTSDINTIKIEIGKLGVKIGMWAALGATASSSVVVFLMEKILL